MTDTAPEHGLPFGEDPAGHLVPIADTVSGLACGLICPQCRQPLIARKGQIRQHHFAHQSDATCAGAFETMLHKLAKQIIGDRSQVFLPERLAIFAGRPLLRMPGEWARFERVDIEVWHQGLRPDLIGYRDGAPIALEIRVTHTCPPEKLQLLAALQIPTVEINLSGTSRTLTYSPLSELVLEQAPRHWLVDPGMAAVVLRHQLATVTDAQRRRAREAAAISPGNLVAQRRLQERHMAEVAAEQHALAITQTPGGTH